MAVRVTVPPIPQNTDRAACVRKTVVGIDTARIGGFAVEGRLLDGGAVVDIPAGTLILSVDKTTLGWAHDRVTGGRVRVEDATVTVRLVASDGSLDELWRRRYKGAGSAYGATTLKRLGRLLAQHPPVEGAITLVCDIRRSNGRPGECRWCRGRIGAGFGQVCHDDRDLIEHWKDCPAGEYVRSGEVCALCGLAVVGGRARRVMVREGEGRWEVRHWIGHWGASCLDRPVQSLEEYRAAREAAVKEADRKKAVAARRAAKSAALKAEKAAVDRAERLRAAGQAVKHRSSETVACKKLGGGESVALVRHVDTLEDDTTAIRWSVEAPEETYDCDEEDKARATYRAHKWSREREWGHDVPRVARRVVSSCPGPGVRHCGNCGTTRSEGGWMAASLGMACGIICYDEMADAPGAHDREYHRGS